MKTFNRVIFKPFFAFLFFVTLAPIAHAIDLTTPPILPPVQTSIIGEGMGNAGVADGTLFNATSFNPALLSKAPRAVELLQLGLSVGNDVFGMIDYIQAGNFPDPGSSFTDLAGGTDAQKYSTVQSLQDFSSNMLNKTVQVGVGDNLALKFDDVFGQGIFFGVQFYNNTHVLLQAKAGSLIDLLNNIPLSGNQWTTTDQTDLNNGITGAMQSSIQDAVNATLNSSQQSLISSDVNAFKNGTEDLSTFKNNVQTTMQNNPSAFQNVDTSSLLSTLTQNIINNLSRDLVIMNTLVYSDFVGMATLSLNPVEDLPLTAGINLKLVRRYFAWETLNPGNFVSGNISGATDFENDLQAGTTRWGVDVGFLYKLEDDINLGLSFQDLVAQSATIPNMSASNPLYGVLSDPAPVVTSIGISYHPINELVINGDLNDLFSNTYYYAGNDLFSRFRFGTAFTLAGILQLRGGFANNNLAGGAGLTLGIIGLDYSYAVDDISQSYNHYAQLKLIF